MLMNRYSRASLRPVTASTFLFFIVLAGCARADNPELFRADPNLLDDQLPNFPATGNSGGLNYAIIQGFAIFEGDIVLGEVDVNGNLPMVLSSRGLGRSDAFGRWPDGIVPYMIPEQSSDIQKGRVAEAIAHWTQYSTLSFVKRTTENQELYPNYIRFDPSNSCASYVGMQGGEQPILISDACSVGSIVHEIGHALGLFHEHTRPDRDNYVQVNWDNVIADKTINFEILNAGVQTYGPYDYESIMHYGEYFFSSSGEPTIVVPDGISIGQRRRLSPLDIDAINNMYATDLVLFQPTLNTVEEGVEIGISIANQGTLGAHQLQLVAFINDSTDWQGISPDSGWQCSVERAELSCERPTLPEQSGSNFTLLVNASSLDASDITLSLSSRTSDVDLSNNSINDDAITIGTGGSQDKHLIESTANSADTDTATAVPSIGAAEEAQQPLGNSAQNVLSTESAAAGSDNGYLAGFAALGLLWQRRRALAVTRQVIK